MNPRYDRCRQTAQALLMSAVLVQVAVAVVAWKAAGPQLTTLPWPLVLSMHAASALLAVAAIGMLTGDDRATTALRGRHGVAPATHPGALRLAALAVAALGPMGVAGVGVALLAMALLRRVGTVTDPTDPTASAATPLDGDDGDGMHGGRVEQQLRKIEAASTNRPAVHPLGDVMAHGTPTQKLDAIAAIGRHFQPSFARTLRLALHDLDPAVRTLAAGTIARVDNAFTATTIRLHSAQAEAPDDRSLAFALAQHLDRHANSGLLDDALAYATRERALEMYRRAGDGGQRSDAAVDHAVIRLLVKLQRETEVIETYREAMDAGQATPALTTWYLEALYRQQRYGDVRRYSEPLLRRHRQTLMQDGRSLESAQLWARAAAAGGDGVLTLEAGGASQASPRVIDVPYFPPPTR